MCSLTISLRTGAICKLLVKGYSDAGSTVKLCKTLTMTFMMWVEEFRQPHNTVEKLFGSNIFPPKMYTLVEFKFMSIL